MTAKKTRKAGRAFLAFAMTIALSVTVTHQVTKNVYQSRSDSLGVGPIYRGLDEIGHDLEAATFSIGKLFEMNSAALRDDVARLSIESSARDREIGRKIIEIEKRIAETPRVEYFLVVDDSLVPVDSLSLGNGLRIPGTKIRVW